MVSSLDKDSDSWLSEMPERYRTPGWRGHFDAAARQAVQPGMRVLDVGSGRTPVLSKSERPIDIEYVGLDVSPSELEAAPPGSYDQKVAEDVCRRIDSLLQSFDCVLSFQVLEHVKPLEAAVENMRRYLRPGGRLVAQLSGRYSAFGLLNRVVPHPVAKIAMERLLSRPRETVFPAHYDQCYESALRRMLRSWDSVEVTPVYAGASYFRFSRPLMKAYVRAENWAERNDRRNLATHYVLEAARGTPMPVGE